jgi:hypothetical protein
MGHVISERSDVPVAGLGDLRAHLKWSLSGWDGLREHRLHLSGLKVEQTAFIVIVQRP